MANRRKFFKNSLTLAALALSQGALQAYEANYNHLEQDGEFEELFTNFINDEVSKHNILDTQTTFLVKIAALIAVQSQELFKIQCKEALAFGVEAVALKELLYQSVPYVGFAKVYDFFGALNEVLKNQGVSLPLPKTGTTTKQNRYEEGLKIQIKFFGESILQGNQNTPDDMKHIREFLSANCFGDYYTRKGLDLKTRELLTFIFLASLGGCESQLKAHTLGNFASGNDRKVLISALTQILPFVGYPRSLNAFGVINEMNKN
ncbi:carboxymuconolactone decarboxylase family protein [Campylobacter sp. MIT 21-1685]|uniref:carboxymuconolactone decarboxylase family protein n=1 Tax=unclassified Campylobacter TaxID=2593542 RepID=UPI00224B2DBC|nr:MULTISPECIES: carboxymuconolactone decarboxylase family protein [unclassified Campylobacter]MCX2683790.1 carboxymuconolactone decarboxylase family protein [Campylobacter sp. MIT 21-1684]MCX2752077.1 carboxymuconolactone decarboxylase family protein [Campylobacter sp. MIT 21-1682]MCX2808270.1 carboxymuconolactone decarboxylase family protein [Campylobacter sp. MIT 21-1685]